MQDFDKALSVGFCLAEIGVESSWPTLTVPLPGIHDPILRPSRTDRPNLPYLASSSSFDAVAAWRPAGGFAGPPHPPSFHPR
jgi:hypothetical protein